MRYLGSAISPIILTFISSGSFAAKYHYEVALDEFLNGQYAEVRTLRGFIETSEPIPPDQNELDISSIVVGWSFTDGVISLTNENSTIAVENILTPQGQSDDVPLVTTNSEGDIVQARIILIEEPATMVGEETTSVQIAGYFPSPLFPEGSFPTFTASGEIVCIAVEPDSVCYAYGFGDNWGAVFGVVGWTTDTDGDGIADSLDNCPSVANTDQLDANSDGFGDVCLDPSAAINDSVDLGEGVVLEEGVSVAKDSSIGDDVEVGENTAIGKGTSIGMDTSVGEDSAVRKATELGTDVTIGNNVTIAKGVSIGANVTIENNVVIRKDVTIGDGVTIGEGAIIEQGAIVLNNVPAGVVVGKG